MKYYQDKQNNDKEKVSLLSLMIILLSYFIYYVALTF